MLDKVTSLLRNDRGQALVELAFVLPILLMLVFGVIEFGRIYSAQLELNHVAREGARMGAINAGEEGEDIKYVIEDLVEDRVASMETDNLTVQISPTSGSELVTGEDITVEINYNAELLTPLFQFFLTDGENSSQMGLSSASTMRIE